MADAGSQDISDPRSPAASIKLGMHEVSAATQVDIFATRNVLQISLEDSSDWLLLSILLTTMLNVFLGSR